MKIKRNEAAMLLCLALMFFAVSQARLIIPLPQPLQSFKINITIPNERASSCSYTVNIKTSCSSTRQTRDRISLAFGDAYGYQVYAPRIDDPTTRTFESCSTDTFKINGPCTYQVCYLYLYRSGYDGWKPESVTVSGYYSKPTTFYYNTFIPSDTWYGFNYCHRVSSASTR